MITGIHLIENIYSLPPALLLALCSVESDFRNVIVEQDGGSPSYGVCQIKEGTARLVGFDGQPEELLKTTENARLAAAYLKRQLKRYRGDYCLAISAYNMGRIKFNREGGYRNSVYVNKVLYRWREYANLSCFIETLPGPYELESGLKLQGSFCKYKTDKVRTLQDLFLGEQ